MIITYIVSKYQPSDVTVEVTYINEKNFEYKRYVSIPHLEDGSVDEDYFKEILEGQLRGVKNKLNLNVIEFNKPNIGIELSKIDQTN